MQSIVLKPNPDIDLSFLFTLLEKLNISYQVMNVDLVNAKKIKPEGDIHQQLQALAGSWQSDLSGEELVAMIYNARQDAPRNIEL